MSPPENAKINTVSIYDAILGVRVPDMLLHRFATQCIRSGVYCDAEELSIMPESLFLAERRRAILEQLRREGRVSVKALSADLNVSAVTIRQDLRALEENGLAERTHGGAMLRQSQAATLLELSFGMRQDQRQKEKEVIGQAAAALVEDGWGIVLDPSTSAFAIIPHLKRLNNLTVVTNSLLVAQQFLDSPHIEVLMPGGRLRRDSVSLVDQHDFLPEIHLNLGFFGARGVTLDAGISEIGPEEAAMKQAMIARCMKTIITVDSSKWGQVAPFTYATVDKIDQIITTELAPAEDIAALRRVGVTVTTVPVPNQDAI